MSRRTTVVLVILLISFAQPAFSQRRVRQTPPSRQLQQAAKPVKAWPGKTRRWALIIGVDDYNEEQITKLSGAANDARTLAQALVQYAGFPQDQVTLLTSDQPAALQPRRSNILRYLSNLRGLVPNDGLLLVAFAGHGIERNGRAFLLPSDALAINDVTLLEDTAISVDRIKELIKSTAVGQVILVLDACRNDPASGRGGADNPMTPGFSRSFNFDVRNREVSAFVTLYATAVGERAYEYGAKKQGYFTWALVEGLRGQAANPRGEVTLAGLLNFIQETVPKFVQRDLGLEKKQRPFAIVEGYKAEDLVIAIATPGAIVETKSTPVAPAAMTSSSAAETSARNADAFRLKEQWSKAEVEYRLALRLEPERADWHGYLGRMLHRQSRLGEAETELREAIRLDPSNAQWHAFLGSALLYQHKYTESELEYRLATRLQPDNCVWRGYLALNLKRQKKPHEVDYREAVRLCEAVIAASPNNSEAYRNLGDIHSITNNWLEAEAAFRKATAISAGSPIYRTLLGGALSAQEKWVEGEAELRRAIQANPEIAMPLAVLAGLLRPQRKLAEAEIAIREALRLEPNSPAYQNQLGYILSEQKRYEQARAAFREALRLDRFAAFESHLGIGWSYAAEKQWADAAAVYEKLLQLDPESIAGNFELAFVYTHQGKLSDAEALYRNVLRLKPDDVWATNNLALILGRLDRTAEAETMIKRALEVNPNEPKLKQTLTDLWERQGRWTDVEAEARKRVAVNPKDATAHANLGFAIYRQHRYADSEAVLKEAVALNPNSAYIRNSLGAALYGQNKFEEAEKEYREALRLDPKYALAHNNIGNALEKRKKTKEAEIEYREAVRLEPTNATFQFDLGYCLGNQRRWAEAEVVYREVIRLNPKHSSAQNNLGVALENQNRLAEAEAQYREAVRLDPTSPKYQTNLQRVLKARNR